MKEWICKTQEDLDYALKNWKADDEIVLVGGNAFELQKVFQTYQESGCIISLEMNKNRY